MARVGRRAELADVKYNLGCGSDYKYGWINADKYPDARPDLLMDLETFPWPIADDAADEILLSHVLEHLGGHSETFLGVMKELYRISKPSATIVVRIPDPRHDDFFSDPTHQRPIVPGLFETLDLAMNENWQSRSLPGTPLAKYLKIDFAVVSVTRHLDEHWLHLSQSKAINDQELRLASRSNNNVVRASDIVLEVRKPFSPGRSLRGWDAVIVKRLGGLGDVLMAVSALSAIKAVSDIDVFLETRPDFVPLLEDCPQIDGVVCTDSQRSDILSLYAPDKVRALDWSEARFGISRAHQVDAFLMSLGLTLPDSGKAIDLPGAGADLIDGYLGLLPRDRRKVIVHPGVTDPNRSLPLAFWRSLVERLLAAGHAVIAIGSRHGVDGRGVLALDEPAVLDLTERLSLAETVELMRRCDVLVSADSGPIQLAGASNIAIVGVYSVVAGQNRLPYRAGSWTHKAIAVAPSCPFHPCYPRLNDGEAVARFRVAEGIEEGDTSALLSRWCVNPDRYACMREPDLAERVGEAVTRALAPPRES